MTYRKRAFTTLVAGALALPFLAVPASAAPGDTATPPVQDIAAFCTNPTSDQFDDVAATDTFALAIRCIATAGITVGGPEGRPDSQYGPNLNIRRGQMATFIARLLDAADDRDRGTQIQDLPAYDGTNEFTDVPSNFIHVDNINRLADAGVVLGGVAGRPATTYSPNDLVSRAQMASFINRAAAFAMGQNPNTAGQSTGYVAPNNADYFVDDENVQIHEPNINGVASQGIVIGVAPASERRYNPTGAVTRAQMAGFIARTLSQLFDDNRIFSLLEIYTESFAAADRESSTRVATPDGQGNTAADSRNFTLTQLDPAVQYRITLVNCENVDRGDNDLVTFTQEMVNGQRLATTGAPDADITQVNGAAPSNNTGVGTTPTTTVTNTAVGTPNDQGVLTFRIDGDTAECVTAVVYVNGGAGRSLEDGGTSPRLEVDANGRPIEAFGISGDTTFVAPDVTVDGEAAVATQGGSVAPGDAFTATVTASNGQPIESVTVTGDCVQEQEIDAPDATSTALAFEVDIAADADLGDCVLTFVTTFQNGTTDSDQVTVNVAAGPQVQAARIGTDAADSDMATGTASQGDIVEITFDRMATESATATPTVTFEDEDGDVFTAECVENLGEESATNTAGTCLLSADGTVLSIELLEDPVVSGDGDGVVDFPATIVNIEGIVDEDGNDVDLANSDDLVVGRDAQTVDALNPADGEADVARQAGSFAPGDSFTATVTASNDQPIDFVTVTGACVAEQQVDAPDDTSTGLAFEVDIAGNAALGDCVLTFVTTFQNGTTDSDQVTVNVARGLQINDARVATDAAQATGTASFAGTASQGDAFVLTFDRIATESATATPTVTFEDEDGDTFTVECVETVGDSVAASNTAATCTLSTDGSQLTIELLGDPVVDGDGDGVAEFPLTVVGTSGIVDADGNDVDLVNSDDVLVDEDDDTTTVIDPSPVP